MGPDAIALQAGKMKRSPDAGELKGWDMQDPSLAESIREGWDMQDPSLAESIRVEADYSKDFSVTGFFNNYQLP